MKKSQNHRPPNH